MLRYIPPTHTKVQRKNDHIEEDRITNIYDETHKTLQIQFVNELGDNTGTPQEINTDIESKELNTLINTILSNEEFQPYLFYIQEKEIISTLYDTIKNIEKKYINEDIINIQYIPQEKYRVKCVKRCSSSLPGHTEAIQHVSFSPNGKQLASGSGDTTVRLWDVYTETPKQTLYGHKNWVMAVSWSPCNKYLASGDMDGIIIIWDISIGKPLHNKLLKNHKKGITALAWQPLKDIQDDNNNKSLPLTSILVASSSMDGTICIWNINKGICIKIFSGHTQSIRAQKWGGNGFLFSGSQDRTIKVWDTVKNTLYCTLEGHAHWVNTLSTNTEYTLRIGPYEKDGKLKNILYDSNFCKKKYTDFLQNTTNTTELLVSGSDDFTVIVWDPQKSNKPIARLTGHQQPVNFVCFSPDGRYISTASFDKSIRIYNVHNNFTLHCVFRSHIQSVYQLAWSSDSRMVLSSSKDSTIKVWDIHQKKLLQDLPGHSDEVYAVDWSPDGERVASGGKDTILKIWRF